MSFARHIRRVPRAFDRDQGAEAETRFGDLAPELRAVLSGAAGSSPYLKGLMEREEGWLRAALEEEPGVAFTSAMMLEEGPVETTLRIAKRRVALFTGIADLAGVWTLEEVTHALTVFADLATQTALAFHVGEEVRRGKLPEAGHGDPATAGGAVALAMGKMGAYELNYSSDIDLIMLFDEERYPAEDFHDARASLIRAVRRMSATLSENTAEGYVFRTDLRLRPDPSVTPVIVSMDAAEKYYESLGRTWERAAFIKARPAAGDLAAGRAFLDRLTPFVYRKHLDFAAIQDAHDMRLRIRREKGLHGEITLPGHDMKLGRGGIREIEFFTQTRQLIAGGRDVELRVLDTVGALAALAREGWIAPEVAERLTRHYRFHREVEHRLQMVRDAQTHKLPRTPEGMERLAAMMDRDVEVLKSDIFEALTDVHALTEDFFAPDTVEPHEAGEVLSEEDAAIVEGWSSYPALRSARAVTIFERLKPELLKKLASGARPREALLNFDKFLRGLPAGVQLFSLFEANPALVDLILDIAATSPALSVYLSANAQVLDAVIGGDFFTPWPGSAGLEEELRAYLDRLDDYESRLDGTRRWMKEWHFRIGVHLLRGIIGAEEAGKDYADLADAVVRALWPLVETEFARKHGHVPGGAAALIGMGSLGARTVTATSDLDLLLIYDAPADAESDGRRPLGARTYYSRLTQAFVTALTAPMPEGRLYEVDMRLRPSGRQGPVATSLAAFESYQRTEAWTWEHLALTRARGVAGDPAICAAVERLRQEVLSAPRDAPGVIADVLDMRARIAEAKAPAGPLEAKIGPGRLQDIDLVAQAAAVLAPRTPQGTVEQIEAGVEIGWIRPDEAEALATAYRTLRRLQSAGKLITREALDLDAIGPQGQAFLCRVLGTEQVGEIEATVSACVARAEAAVNAVLGRLPGEA